MKKTLAALLCLILCLISLLGMAEEDDIIVSYAEPEGISVLTLDEASSFIAPSGLEPMYELMLDADSTLDVYLFRMKNGRALMSVSCMDVEKQGTAEELLALWPDIAGGISLSVPYVNNNEACADIETLFGFEALCIQTDIAVTDQAGQALALNARGIAFYRSTELMEVWMVTPATTTYLYDDEAAAELQSDVYDLNLLFESLSFSKERAPSV